MHAYLTIHSIKNIIFCTYYIIIIDVYYENNLRLGALLCLPPMVSASVRVKAVTLVMHPSIKSLIQKHLSAAGIPAHLEPTG